MILEGIAIILTIIQTGILIYYGFWKKREEKKFFNLD